MTEPGAREGGCLCGAVRYRAAGEPLWVVYCHCRDCRRSIGAPVAAYAGFPAERVIFTAGAPAAYASSPGVARRFCGRCGTPISYEGERWAGEIHLHVATFDAPETLSPTREVFTRERLPWLHLRVAAPDAAG